MKNLLRFALAFLCLSGFAFAQGSYVSFPVQTPVGQAIPGAVIALCSTIPTTATPCGSSSLQQTYSDITLGTACSLSVSVLGPTSGPGCTNPGLTDGYGMARLYVNGTLGTPAGYFYYQAYGQGIVVPDVEAIMFPGGSGGGSSGITGSGFAGFLSKFVAGTVVGNSGVEDLGPGGLEYFPTNVTSGSAGNVSFPTGSSTAANGGNFIVATGPGASAAQDGQVLLGTPAGQIQLLDTSSTNSEIFMGPIGAGTTLQFFLTGSNYTAATGCLQVTATTGLVTSTGVPCGSGGGGGGSVTSVGTGTGLTGGPITGSGTIALASTAVTPGSYTNTNVTVNAQGQITAATNGSSGTSAGSQFNVQIAGSGGSFSAIANQAAASPFVSQGTAAPIFVQGISYATTAQNWSQSGITTSCTAGSPCTVTLSAGYVGIDVGSGFGYQLLICEGGSTCSGGTTEAVNVTGGTYTSGGGGTVIFTPNFNHPASSSYIMESASSGLQETANICGGTNSTAFQNRQCNLEVPANGPIYTAPVYNTYNVYGTIFWHFNQSVFSGYGVSLRCLERGACIQVGDQVNANDFQHNTISGFHFLSPVSLASNPSFAGVQVTNTVVSGNVATITTASAHGFRVGDMVTTLFTDDSAYWGDAIVTTVPTATTFTYAHPKNSGSIASQVTPGVVALAYEPILDNSNYTHFLDLGLDSTGASGEFNNVFDFWDDENATITHYSNNAIKLNFGANWMGSHVFSGGAEGFPTATQFAPVITMRDSSITANFASCVTVFNSNGVYLDNDVCQSTALWEVNVSNTNGNFQGATIKDIYNNGTSNLNPLTPARTPYPGVGTAGLIAGVSTGAASFNIKGNGGVSGSFATGGSGSIPYTYYIVVNDSTANTQTSPMQILNYESTGSDSITVRWPRVASAADTITYDVIRMTTPTATNPYPYNGGCPGGTLGACGSVATALSQATACSGSLVCSFTDTGSSSTASYAIRAGQNNSGNQAKIPISFWPGSIVTASKSVNVDQAQTPIVGVELNNNPAQIATNCYNGAPTSPGGYTACTNSWIAPNNALPNQTATIFSDGSNSGGALSESKGKLNFPNSPYATTQYPHDIITLVDQTPGLTLATQNFRPLANANDVAIGTDVTSAGTLVANAQLAFRAPVFISQYIASLPDNASWKTRLSSSLFEFNTPVQFDQSAKFQTYHDVQEIASPANPSSGYERWYANLTTHQFTCLTSSGGSCGPTGGGSGTVTSVASGTGLTGGPITTTGTLAIANTGVSAGTYASANITVNAQGQITSASAGGSSTAFQANTVALASASTINFENSTAFNGLTATVSNPSAGNVQLGLSGSLGNAGLANSSVTLNSQAVALGASANIPFQTSTVNNSSLAGLNFVASSADAVGLHIASSNPSGIQERFEVTGSSYTGNAATATNLAGCAGATLGDTCYYGGSAWVKVAGPNTPNGIPQIWSSTPSGGSATAPAWGIPGVGVDSQTGTSYTIPIADDVHFVTGNNGSATAWTGFTLANNYAFSFQNLGSGLITYTPASGTVNGSSTQIIPQNWFGFHYTDNTNTFMPVIPTQQAFTDCHASNNALTFTASTGKLGCNSIAAGGSVTSITASSPLTGGTITTSGTIGLGTLTAGSNGLANSATTDTTNASNISSGTLPIARVATSGTGTKVQTTNLTTSASGDIATLDGAGNTVDSGTLLSSLSAQCISHYVPIAGPSDQLTAAGTFATTVSIASNCMAVGTLITIRAHGVYTTTTTASPKLSFQVNAGGTSGICPAPTSAQTLNVSQVNGYWDLTCYVKINTTGSPGTAVPWGSYIADLTAGSAANTQIAVFNNPSTGTLAFTTGSTQTASIQEVGTFVTGQTINLTVLDVTVAQ